MATSKDLTKSSTEGSEELFDVNCNSCNDHGKTTMAKKFCVECGLHFCLNCLGVHKIIPLLQSHQIVDYQEISQGKVEKVELLRETCSIHHGKLIDMFCGDHDEVCCGACIAIQHRSCINVKHVSDEAEGIRMSKEYEDVKHSITEVLDDMKKEKARRTANITSLEEEKTKNIQEVDKYQEEQVLKIKEIAESSREDIRSKYGKIKKVIMTDVDTLDTLISTTDRTLQKLSITNEVQLFVNVKASKIALNDGNSVLREMSSGWTKKQLQYSFDENLKDIISNMVSFGNFADGEDVKEYKATAFGKFNIKENTDSASPAITGICHLQNGSILLADYQNKKLKRLNSNYTTNDSISVNGSPIGICNVGKHEVAVCLFNVGKIQFVSIENNLKLASNVVVDNRCHGIAYNDSNDEMYACCGTSVIVYSRTGTVVRTHQKDPNGGQLFSATRQILLNSVKNQIVVSDSTNGLEAINTQGSIVWRLNDKELQLAWGLCSLPNGDILVCGSSSKNVLQVDKTGKKLRTVLESSEGLSSPYSLAFDRYTSRLIVGCADSKIHVYTISVKKAK